MCSQSLSEFPSVSLLLSEDLSYLTGLIFGKIRNVSVAKSYKPKPRQC